MNRDSHSLLSWLQNKLTSIVGRIRGNTALPTDHHGDLESVADGNEEADGDSSPKSGVDTVDVKSGPTSSADAPKPVSLLKLYWRGNDGIL